ncbi:MAG TPA: Mur ligase family protein, partial [Arenimonas sp.]|nr:Mur ligase family protein [Arenimonas sp.]
MRNAFPPLPFSDSRRLTGPNLYFAQPGAVLETVGDGAEDAARFAAWRDYVARGRSALGWPDAPLVVRQHRGGAALAFAAPVDQLLTATELNEAAWQAACDARVLHAPGHPAGWDEASALHTLQRYAAMEIRPTLRALLAAAQARGTPALLDDEQLTLGLGRYSRSWPLDALPDSVAVPWDTLKAIPVALVTGSNGKTTTVRLLAALLRAQGLQVSHSCTDGVFIDDAQLESGDWSGPAGARAALRHPQAEAAVLETARGGILRRGLAVDHADAA